MRDVNSVLKQKLYQILSGVLDYPVYQKYIPASVDESAYVLITTINNNDTSTMQSNDTDTTVQIGIYTKDSQANAGAACDTIAQTIYETIYPTPDASIDLSPNFQNCGLKLVNDFSPEAMLTGSFVFINRFLIFRLNIFHH